MSAIVRCGWCGTDPLYIAYHDQEWGVPIHEDQTLFEFLVLEGAQAGLSWITVLRKRKHYRKVFHQFDPNKVANMQAVEVDALLTDPGIIRNRLKVQSAITNAQAFLATQSEFGSFAKYIWQFVEGVPQTNHFAHASEVPATTKQSDAMSRDLRKRGFGFVGSTICYAYMQGIGMVNDHLTSCYRHAAVESLRAN
jgi:DNA-3-methyladenine glycosylase I